MKRVMQRKKERVKKKKVWYMQNKNSKTAHEEMKIYLRLRTIRSEGVVRLNEDYTKLGCNEC